MRWDEQVDLFERELKAQSQKPLTLPFRSILRALGPADYLDEAAEACRAFARTRRWPALSDEARLEVCLSLECAVWYCGNAVIAGRDRDDEEPVREQEQIESVLVEYWQDVGRSTWLWRRHILTPEERDEGLDG